MTKRLILMSETMDVIVRYLEVPRMSHMIEVEFRESDPIQIPLTIWVNQDLKIGMALDGAQLEQLRTEAVFAKARNKALYFLKFKPRTERELQTYLCKQAFSDEMARRVVNDLVQTGLMDDAAYTKLFAQQKRGMLSRRELSWKLEQRGVSRSVSEAVLDELYPRDDEWQTARAIAAKFDRKQLKLPIQKRRQRLGGHLHRHGFPPGMVRQLVYELVTGNVDEECFLDND